MKDLYIHNSINHQKSSDFSENSMALLWACEKYLGNDTNDEELVGAIQKYTKQMLQFTGNVQINKVKATLLTIQNCFKDPNNNNNNNHNNNRQQNTNDTIKHIISDGIQITSNLKNEALFLNHGLALLTAALLFSKGYKPNTQSRVISSIYPENSGNKNKLYRCLQFYDFCKKMPYLLLISKSAESSTTSKYCQKLLTFTTTNQTAIRGDSSLEEFKICLKSLDDYFESNEEVSSELGL